MFKRKLFKRALPIVLSVAMVFQSMPATALAAETEIATEVETGTDDSGEVQEPQESVDDSGEVQEPQESVDDSGEVQEPQENVDDSGEAEPKNDNPEDDNEVQVVNEEVREAEGDTSAAAQKAEITVGIGSNAFINKGIELKADADSKPLKFTGTYDGVNFDDVESIVKNNLSIKIDGETSVNGVLIRTLLENVTHYKYQKKGQDAEGRDIWENIEGVPVNVGSYRLIIAIDENNLCAASTAEENDYIYFEITPKKLAFDRATFNAIRTANPGSSVSVYIDNIKKNYKFDNDIVDYYKSLTELEVVVRENGKTEQTADTTFDKTKDYQVVVTVKFKETYKEIGENCELDADDYYVIALGNLTKTEVSVERKEDKKGEDIIKTYDGNDLDMTKIVGDYINADTLKVTAIDKDDDKDGKDDVITDAKVTSALYTRENSNNIDLGDLDEDTQFDLGVYRYTLAEKTADVGEYYLIYKYSGEKGKYEESYSTPIQVTVEAVSLVLEPKAIELTVGMDKYDVNKVLAKAVYVLKNAATGAVFSDPSSENLQLPDDFFGAAYGSEGTTQYFTPVFRLEVRQKWDQQYIAGLKEGHEADEEWKEWQEWSTSEYLKSDDDNSAENVITASTAEKTLEYRIISTGEKAVYDAYGEASVSVPITDTTTNSAEKNYKVKADEETREKNAGAVTIKSAAAVDINVSKIVEPFKNGDGGLDTPAKKVYDGDPLFAARADYKKASVGNASAANTADADNANSESFTYTWQRLSDEGKDLYQKYLQASDEKDAKGRTKKEEAREKLLKDGFVSVTNNGSTIDGAYISPSNANLYRLKIDYKDKANKNQSATKYVYFKIEKQAFITVAGKQYGTYGADVGPSDADKANYSISLLENNDPAKAAPVEWNYNKDNVKWATEIKDANDTNDKWVKIADSDSNNNGVRFNKGDAYRRYFYYDDDNNIADTNEVRDADGSVVVNKNGNALYWSNFTNVKEYDAEGLAWKYYTIPSDVIFGAGTVGVKVTDAAMPKDTVYNAKSATEAIDINTLISLSGRQTGSDDEANTGCTINTTEVGPGDDKTVYVYWKWDYNNSEVDVPFNKAVYGGKYTLCARFAGNDAYTAFDRVLTDADGEPYTFEIKALEIGIAPVLRSDAAAGETVGELLDQYQLAVTGEIPEEDKHLFEYVEEGIKYNYKGEHEVIVTWNDYDIPKKYTGYGILENSQIDAGRLLCYKDGTQIGNDTYLRYDKEYTAKFNDLTLYGRQYAASYEVIYKVTTQKITKRAETDVQGTDFLTRAIGGEPDGYVEIRKTTANEGGNNTTYTVTPREAVPFVYNGYYNPLGNVEKDGGTVTLPMDKNYIAFNIMVPNEFLGVKDNENLNTADSARFVFANSINAADGYVYKSAENWQNGIYAITVLFPVEKDETGSAGVPDSAGQLTVTPQFDVTWENGYTETFVLDLTNAVLESNLKAAAAPKSLAFNAAQKKMAVGEVQQLDIKITKVNLGDVIRINYRAVGNDAGAVYVDHETGRVTALKADKKAVTIEAYPVRLSDDGKTYEEITGKGVKIAKTKIVVTDVTAPAIKKIIPSGTTAEIQFTHVNDGWRREIYVKEIQNADKKELKEWTNKKLNKFEEAINGMSNGDWEEAGFARAPIYITGDTYNGKVVYDKTLKLDKITIDDLDIKKTYVVYVRNVSAARTLADGTAKVDLSAAGTSKSFVTTKSQVMDLVPWFEVENERFKVENDIKTENADFNQPTKKNPVVYYTDKNGEVWDGSQYGRTELDKERSKEYREYTVDFLTTKSVQLNVDGVFFENASNTAAEDYDTIFKTLPIKKDENYADPKLTYAVFDDYTDYDYKYVDDKLVIGRQSKFATIAKNGKLTLKGVDTDGEAVVYIFVFAENEAVGVCKLHITANATEVKGKKAKLKVGDQVRLAALLEYKGGRTKVPEYRSTQIEIDESVIKEAEENGFRLEQVYLDKGSNEIVPESVNGERYVEGEWVITAVSAGKYDLTITDKSIGTDGQGMSAAISLTSAQLDPVKNLKAAYVDDSHITLNFAHPGNPEAFDIEAKDAAGRVVYKRLVYNNIAVEDDEGYYDESLGEYMLQVGDGKLVVKSIAKPYLQELQRSIIGDFPDPWGRVTNDCLVYFEKTKNYAYTIATDKLLRLTAYTITVTPVFENEKAAKPATTKTKTTNVPASYNNKNFFDPEDIWNYYDTPDELYYVSGNTYTLSFNENNFAKDRITDTLTWQSSDSKVASVKANAGTYTAALKAGQQGTSVITVTSKITKKVAARYLVAVRSAGNGNAYTGDYERGNRPTTSFYDDIVFKYDPLYEGRLEVLTLSNPVTVDESYLYSVYKDVYGNKMTTDADATWVQFTAPVFGKYTFEHDTWNSRISVYSDRKLGEGNRATGSAYNRNGYVLEAGQKIYFRICGTFTLRVTGCTDFARLTIANDCEKNAFEVTKASYISFTAPEDNYYTFTTVKENKENADQIRAVKMYNSADRYQNTVALGIKKGDTILLDISGKCYLYIERRVTESVAAKIVTEAPDGVNVTFEKPEKDTEYPIEKWVEFTAPASTYYTFEVQQAKELNNAVTIEYYTLTGEKKLTNITDDIVSNNAKAEPVKEEHYIQAGETILIKLSVKETKKSDYTKAFIGDTKSLDVTIKVIPAEAIDELKDGSVIKPETVAVVSCKIPEGHNRYTIKIKGTKTKIDNVRDSEGNILGTVVNGDSFTFEVNEDKTTSLSDKNKGITVKAGDTIYLQVRNEDKKEEGTISITTKSGANTIKTEPITIELVDGCEEWYTFTAEKAGFYKVEADVIPDPAKSKDLVHGLEVYEETAVFISRNSNKYITPYLKKLKSGENLVLRVKATDVNDEDIKTTASLSITPIEVTPLKLGEEAATEVTLNSKDEVKYYSFTASDTTDTYTIKWTPADDEQGKVTVSTGTAIDSLNDNNFTINKNTIITYIAVKQTSFLSAKGKLSVTAGKSVESLKAGAPKDFSVAKDDTKEYSFIIGSNPFGYVVEVTNKMKAETKTEYPIEVKVGNSTEIIKAGETGRFALNSTGKYTIKVKAAEAGVDAAIKVSAYEPVELTADKTEVDVTDVEAAWYKYEIPASGRYILASELDKANKAKPTVSWTKKEAGKNYYDSNHDKYGNSIITSDADYFKKGTILYAKITNNSIGEAGKVTINKPSLLAPTKTLELNKEEKVELASGQTAEYCMFTAPENGYYTVKSAPNSMAKTGYLSKNGGTINTSNFKFTLEKDEKIFVKVTDSTTIKVEKTILDKIDGEKEITLKNRETASYEFMAYKDGVYEFKSASELSELTLSSTFGPSTIKTYKAAQLKAGQKVTLNITWTSNDEAAEATFKISASELTPSKSVADKDTLDVKKNSVEWYEYTTAKFGKYSFAVSKPDNAAKDVAAPQKSVYMYNSKKAEYESITSEDLTEGRKILIAVANTGEADASYNFTDGFKAYDNVLDFEGSEERTIIFKPEKTGIYKFSVNALDDGEFKISGSEIVNSGAAKKFIDLSDDTTTNILHKGETYTFTVKQEGSEKSSAAYNIVLDTTIPVYEAASDGYKFAEDEKSDSVVIIEFTAAKTGDYIVEAAGTGIVSRLEGNVVIENPESVKVNEDIFTLAAGERIYLQVEGAKKDFTLKLNSFADFNLTEGKKGRIDETDTGLHLYKLIVPETDTYELSRAVVEKTEEEKADTNFVLNQAIVYYRIDNRNWQEMNEGYIKTVSDKTVYLKVSTGLDEPPKKGDTDTTVTKYGYDIQTAKYEDIKDAKGTIKKDETKYFKWVVPEEGEYTIVKDKGTDEAPNVFTVQSKTDVNDSYYGDFSGFNKRELNEKEEYYFKITTTTTEESSSYGLTISKFVPTPLGDGKGEIKKTDEAKTFEWTAAGSGQYIIDYDGTAEVKIKKKAVKSTSFINVATLSKSETVDTYNGTNEDSLNIKKGDTLRFEVSYQQQDEDKACDYSITVKKVPWKPLENGGKLEASGSFKISGKYDYYWFNAKPDTTYFVEITSKADKEAVSNSSVIVKSYTYNDGGMWQNKGTGSTVYDKDGGFIYFRVEKGSSAEFADKEVEYTLSLKTYGELGDGKGSVNEGETKYFEYTVKTDGDYIIEYTGDAEVKLNGVKLNAGITEKNYTKLTKLKFKVSFVKNEVEDNKTCNYEITVKKLEDVSTKLEVDKGVNDKEIGSTAHYYEFTAASGRYVLEFSGNVNVTGKSGEAVNDSRIFLDFDSSSDKTKYFTVVKTGAEEKEKYSIIVKSYTPLTVGGKEGEGEFTAKTDKYAYYKLETEGFYAVEFSSEKASAVDRNGDSLGTTVTVTKNSPEYFVVTKNNADDEGVKYMLNVKDFIPLTAGTEVSNDKLKAGEYAYYKFTNDEPESKDYILTVSGTAMAQYYSSGWYGGAWNNASNGYEFTLGSQDTKYFRIKEGSSGADDYNYKLTINSFMEYKEAKLGEDGTANLSGSVAKDDHPAKLKFIVDETAVYKLTQKVNGTDSEPEYMTCDADDSVIRTIHYVSNEEDKATTYDVKLEKVKPESLSESKTIEIDAKEVSVDKYYEFTAPQDGEYVVESSDALTLSKYYIHQYGTMRAEVKWESGSYSTNWRLKLCQGETLGLYVNAVQQTDPHKLSIKLKPYAALSLNTEKSGTAKADEYVYFSYTENSTPSKDGYYVYLKGFASADYSTVDVSLELDASNLQDGVNWWSANIVDGCITPPFNIAKGDTLYIRARKDATEEYTIEITDKEKETPTPPTPTE